jgi:error-prone DNA polymerase
LERLAEADVFRSLGIDRCRALWEIEALGTDILPLFAAAERQAVEGGAPLIEEEAVSLPAMGLGHHVAMDYARVRLSLKAHPMLFLRERMNAQGRVPLDALAEAPNGTRLAIAGLVTVRQRPGTAKGVIFATLEDETATANVIIWPRAFELYRRVVLSARVLGVRGYVQREGIVIHVIADHLDDLTPYLAELLARPAKDLDSGIAHGDEVRRDSRPDARILGDGRLSARGRRAAKVAYPSRDFH